MWVREGAGAGEPEGGKERGREGLAVTLALRKSWGEDMQEKEVETCKTRQQSEREARRGGERVSMPLLQQQQQRRSGRRTRRRRHWQPHSLTALTQPKVLP
jgi:hypothetical protein